MDSTPLDQSTPEVRLQGATLVPWLLLAGVVIGIVAFLQSGKISVESSLSPAERRTKHLQQLAERNIEFGNYLDEARKHTSWDALHRFLEDISKAHAEADKISNELAKTISQLDTSKEGRLIASKPELVDQYGVLSKSHPVTKREINALGDLVKKYQALSNEVKVDRTVIVGTPASWQSELTTLYIEAKRLLAATDRDRLALTALVNASKENPKSGRTLEMAMHLRNVENAKEYYRVERSKIAEREQRSEAELKLQNAKIEARTARAKAIVDEAIRKLAEEK
jgi:hypothetical protein